MLPTLSRYNLNQSKNITQKFMLSEYFFLVGFTLVCLLKIECIISNCDWCNCQLWCCRWLIHYKKWESPSWLYFHWLQSPTLVCFHWGFWHFKQAWSLLFLNRWTEKKEKKLERKNDSFTNLSLCTSLRTAINTKKCV